MTKTLWKKAGAQLLQTFVLLVGITFITFLILHLSPGNPAELWLTGGDGNVGQVSEEAIRAQEEKMGLDRPFLVQYGSWLGKLLQGDMGESMATGRPVAEELGEHVLPTLALAFSSLLLSVLISVPLGIYCAVYKDRWPDQLVRGFSFLGISLPSFFISLVFLWLFCMKLGWFPVIAGTGLRGMILPMAVLTIQCATKFTRQVRALILDQLGQAYVMGAVARGVDRRTILFSHVLKNALVPILNWCGIYLGVLLGGAAVVETIFSYEGMGKLAIDAVNRLDYFMIQGFVLWIALIFLGIHFVVDLACMLIDPRLKES